MQTWVPDPVSPLPCWLTRGSSLTFYELVPFQHLPRGRNDTCQRHPGDCGLGGVPNTGSILCYSLFSFPVLLFITKCTPHQIQKILKTYNEMLSVKSSLPDTNSLPQASTIPEVCASFWGQSLPTGHQQTCFLIFYTNSSLLVTFRVSFTSSWTAMHISYIEVKSILILLATCPVFCCVDVPPSRWSVPC